MSNTRLSHAVNAGPGTNAPFESCKLPAGGIVPGSGGTGPPERRNPDPSGAEVDPGACRSGVEFAFCDFAPPLRAGRAGLSDGFTRQKAAASSGGSSMREIGHFIGGKPVTGTSGRHGEVFDPNTGEVQAKVAFAKHAEVEHAIAVAQAAFPAWAATNPQRRARVLVKFIDLVQNEFDELAKLLSSEHGKTIPDSKGDIQRGLEVIEFACGIPHLMKGEFTEGAGP